MSLVDYAYSSDDEDKDDIVPDNDTAQPLRQDDEDVIEGEEEEEKENLQPAKPEPANTQRSEPSLNPHPKAAPPPSAVGVLPLPSLEKLPDASFLLNSPTFSSSLSGTDHASRVAAAMAESESRKRDSKGLSGSSSSGLPRSKVPRGNLLHMKNVPDTDGGLLLPPQLRGRSNIVTEDIGKLFVKRSAEPSSH